MSENDVILSPESPDDPAWVAPERQMLVEFLDYYRDVLLRKCSGLTQAQLATRLGPSSLTLAGLLKHMALVEQHWFHECWLGAEPTEPWAGVDWEARPDWDFETATDDAPQYLGDLYVDALARSRAAIDGCDDLAATVDRRGQPVSLRWILVHMIEEYARHCGHADLLREAVDGVTGD